MRQELQDKLIEKYPYFFAEAPDRPTPFHWRCNDRRPIVGVQCRDGWYDLLDATIMHLVSMDPDARVTQIKEKWGQLTIYLEGYGPGVHEFLFEVRERSKSVCDICGGRGRWLTTPRGAVATRCEVHANE